MRDYTRIARPHSGDRRDAKEPRRHFCALETPKTTRAMGQSFHYRPADFSDAEVEALRLKLVDAAGRMTDDQVLMLADTLHEVMRRRRGSRSFQRVDMSL